MEAFIKRLRRRAVVQKFFAFLALSGAVFIVIIGADYFIYESPKIAVQDIEQQRKIASPSDAISRLADLNMSIHNTNEELNTASIELDRIKKVLNIDGNYGFSTFKYSFYYDLLIKIDRNHYSPISGDSYKKSFNLNSRNLNQIDALLNDIKKATMYLESDEAKDNYISDVKTQQDSKIKYLHEKISNKGKLEEELKYALDTVRKIGESNAPNRIRDMIIDDEERIRETEKQIKEFDEKMGTGDFLRDAEAFVNQALEINKIVIEQIEEYRLKVVNNLNHSKEKLPEQEELVKRLRTKKFNLDAEKEVASTLRSDAEPINDSKVAFYISTNIARLGIMIVTIFLAQVFISIYRYLTKISNFYHARADVLEILTQTETLKDADLSSLIEVFSNIFSPEKVDFGRMPQAPINETVKGAQSIFAKS